MPGALHDLGVVTTVVEFFALLAFVVALGAFLLWDKRRLTPAVVFALLSVTAAIGLVEMKSRPKSVVMEWRAVEEADVLWYGLIEGESITLLLDVDGPRLYVLAWDKDSAEQLLKAGQDAGQGGKVKMARPFEPSLAPEERLFYAAPQSAPPPKG